jgi:uncharacterized protein involved in exopolysaccharide biosynthesis
MELIDLLRVMRRWLWLIVAIVVVTELALWFGTRSAESVYAATARLQISTPQREEVAAYDQYRFNPRDEITVAINNFVELLQSDEVYKRTVSQLSLKGNDAVYTVDAVRASDADFVNVTIEARTPDLAADIANTHIGNAIAYYGQLRAQSTKAEQNLFAEQLLGAEKELESAEKALTDQLLVGHVHCEGVGVALTESIGSVPAPVEIVQPVAHLVHHDRRVGAVDGSSNRGKGARPR